MRVARQIKRRELIVPSIAISSAHQLSPLSGVEFKQLPPVTQEDLQYLAQMRVATKIKTPLPAFKMANQVTSVALAQYAFDDPNWHPEVSGVSEERAQKILNYWSDPRNTNKPAVFMTLSEDQALAAALSHKTGRSFRIPTEAEVEYSIRGRTDQAAGQITVSKFYFGDSDEELAHRAWLWSNSGRQIHEFLWADSSYWKCLCA